MVRLPPGSLIGLPDEGRLNEWIQASAGPGGPGDDQAFGRITLRHYRPGLIEVDPDSRGARLPDVDSLLDFVSLLGRLYRVPMTIVSRLPLEVFRRRLNHDSAADTVAAMMLRGITVVVPYPTVEELDSVAEAVGPASVERYPDGEWVLVRQPADHSGPMPIEVDYRMDGALEPRVSARPNATREPEDWVPWPVEQASGAPWPAEPDAPVDVSLGVPVPERGSGRQGGAGGPGARGGTGSFAEVGRRWLNVLLVDPAGRQVTAQCRPVADYLLRIAIGLPAVGNVISGGQPFPAGQLPHTQQGWCLDVVVTGPDVAVDHRARELFLPVTGESWVCDCGWRAASHTCSPVDRRVWLDVPFSSPERPGPTTVEIRVYYGAVLLQAAEVAFTVGDWAAEPPHGSITYCRDPMLGDLGSHTGRSLSCHLHGRDTDRHLLAINNGQAEPLYFEFGDEQTAQAASALRTVLYDTHLDGDAKPRHGEGPSGQPVKSAREYADDLRRLAGAGARVYRALLVDSTDERRVRQWLLDAATATGGPAVIQVARSADSRLSLPWQLVYDEPLIDGASAAALCDSVWEWGPGATPSGPPPAHCPNAGRHDRYRGTICPFGFWGLAHVIESPPSTRTRLLPRITSQDDPPQLIAAVNDALLRWNQHVERLSGMTGDPKLPVATSWPQLRLEAADGSDVLYFYCHGRFEMVDGLPPHQPVLDLGGGSLITPERLSAWSTMVRWDRRQPLVVLNGCGTGEVLPDLLATFVDAFVNSLHAAGVLATEIAVESRAAQYAAELLLSLLWQGHRAGAAVRAMRWGLLSGGSVFGLAYTPYCDAFLGLPTPASTGAEPW